MSTATLRIGDVFDVMATMPDGSVDFVVTSPPFLALRSYLPPGHPLKDKEIGSERDPASFIDVMLALTAEWGRLLPPWGSIAVELGDTYAGSGGAGGDYNAGGLRDGQEKFTGSWKYARTHDPEKGPPISRVSGTSGAPGGKGWPLSKSLCGIPDAYSLSLQYGFNVLRGPDHPSPAGRWRVRNRIVWARPNPPVGSLGGRRVKDENGEKIGRESGDRFRTATSIITVATRSDHAWFDLDGVRIPASEKTNKRVPEGTARYDLPSRHRDGNWKELAEVNSDPEVGSPPLDFAVEEGSPTDGWTLWVMSPTGYSGAHYAVYPGELPKRVIQAMCPREVCRECGEPRRRIVAPSERYAARPGAGRDFNVRQAGQGTQARGGSGGADMNGLNAAEYVTLGWTDCGHDNYRPGIVLDPFSGSGTTLAITALAGLDGIGIDIDTRNMKLHRTRIRDEVYIRDERLRSTGVWFPGAFSSWNRGPYERPPVTYISGRWVCDERVPKETRKKIAIAGQRSLFDLLETAPEPELEMAS